MQDTILNPPDPYLRGTIVPLDIIPILTHVSRINTLWIIVTGKSSVYSSSQNILSLFEPSLAVLGLKVYANIHFQVVHVDFLLLFGEKHLKPQLTVLLSVISGLLRLLSFLHLCHKTSGNRLMSGVNPANLLTASTLSNVLG